MFMLRNLWELVRPYQYVKNIFIFLPAFFAFRINEPAVLSGTFIAFCAFSLVASAVYILNDWFDRRDDAGHPVKKYRPIAAGHIPGHIAFVLAALLLIAGGLLAYSLAVTIFMLTAAYFLMNALYSYKLKHVPIVDITLIGFGFVIRLLVGAEVAHVPLSPWIIVLTFLLALFLSLAKRRDDVLIYLKTDKKMRKSIDGYNLKYLDSAMVMTASIVIPAYILWTFSTEIADKLDGDNLYLTSGFVILGILRYKHIVFVQEKSGNPSMILLTDRFLQLVLLGWMASLIWILYL